MTTAIMVDVYESGDVWTFRAGGFKEEIHAQNGARAALDGLPNMRVSYSPVSANFYGWALDEGGDAALEERDEDPTPEYQTHYYSPRPDYWCVWGYGFVDESACDSAVDRAIANAANATADVGYERRVAAAAIA